MSWACDRSTPERSRAQDPWVPSVSSVNLSWSARCQHGFVTFYPYSGCFFAAKFQMSWEQKSFWICDCLLRISGIRGNVRKRRIGVRWGERMKARTSSSCSALQSIKNRSGSRGVFAVPPGFQHLKSVRLEVSHDEGW